MMRCYCCTAALVIALLACVAPRSVTGQTAAPTNVLRVGCHAGFPPFTDEDDAAPLTRCNGLFADVFYEAASRMNLNYTMEVITTSDVDTYLEESVTNRFDMFVAFHTVTPGRVAKLKFSPTVFQTDYRIALDPTFFTNRVDLLTVVLRKSVIYVLSVVALCAALYVPLLFICESFWGTDSTGQPSGLLALPLWERVFTAMEMAIEAALTASTAMQVNNFIARLGRSVVAVVGFLYLVNIFNALLTSQLTTSALQAGDPTLADLRNVRIAASSVTLSEFLSQSTYGLNIVTVPSVEEYAKRFYNRTHHEANGPVVHGFVAPSATVRYLHTAFGGQDNHYTMSNTFSPSGTSEIKAFPFRFNVADAIFIAFNVQIQNLREDGTLAQLTDKWVPSVTTQSSDDFPTTTSAVTGLATTCIVLLVLLVAITLALFAYDCLTGKEASAPTSPTKGIEPAGSDDDSVLYWKGEAVRVESGAVQQLLDGLVKHAEAGGKSGNGMSPKGEQASSAATFDGGDEPDSPRTLMGMPMDPVRNAQQLEDSVRAREAS